MKKIILAMLVLTCSASFSFAGDFGLGLKIGGGQNDPKDMKDAYDMYGGELTRGYGIVGIEGLYEWDMTETGKLGLRLGIDIYGENEYKYMFVKATETTYAIPLTLYYKWGGIKALNFYIGGGATYINSELEVASDKESEGKVFPHVVAGAEYRFSQVFALGIEAKYNISAKVEKDGEVYSDRSGINGALVARFYF